MNETSENSLIGKVVCIDYGTQTKVIGLLKKTDSMHYFFDGYYKKWKQSENFEKGFYTVKHTATSIRLATEYEMKIYNAYKNNIPLPDPFNMMSKSRL